MDRPQQRPEGALLGHVIDATPTMSRRSVAQAAGLSEARVRQIVNGYASAGRGQSVDVIAPPETLARLAAAVGLTEEDLRGAGREDAADVLARSRPAPGRQAADMDLDLESALVEFQEFVDNMEEIETPPAGILRLFGDEQLLAEVSNRLQWRGDQVREIAFERVRRNRQESDQHGRESAAKSEAEGTSAQDAANDTAARERSESTDSEGPARGPHSRTRSGASPRTGIPHGGGTAGNMTP